jgi:hypothetical protein
MTPGQPGRGAQAVGSRDDEEEERSSPVAARFGYLMAHQGPNQPAGSRSCVLLAPGRFISGAKPGAVPRAGPRRAKPARAWPTAAPPSSYVISHRLEFHRHEARGRCRTAQSAPPPSS